MDSSIELGLYVVATPIGNLKDITLRALEVLKKADIIAAEDTRQTSVLLDKYDIKTKLISYHKFNETARIELFLSYLRKNKSIALVSDAGTPLISDPGAVLVDAIKKEGFRVIPIVGPSAILALLSAIPRQDEDFKFIGFLPKNKNQISEIIEKNEQENLVFFESPKRITAALETIEKTCPDRKIAIGRELTKKFEEIKVDTIQNIIEYYKNNPLKGEFAVLLYKKEVKLDIGLDKKIKKLKELDLKDKQIASILAQLYDLNKNEVYKKCLEY